MMQVAFLYNQPGHAAPVLRSRDHMREFDVELSPHLITDGAPVSAESYRGADVILLQEPPVRNEVVESSVPVILLERIDGAQLRAARSYLPRVSGVIKGYTFRDRERYNKVYDRAHVETLAKAGISGARPRACRDRPQPQLCPGDLARIRPGYGFGSYDIQRQYAAAFVDFDAPRPYDVHFAGVVDYQDSEVETHRRLALRAAQTWGLANPGKASCGAGRVFTRDQYPIELLRSKAVLCPWGWGESCHRDYQALALGCVVIKPNSDYVECWPDVYVAGKTYVACKPDFSDVHEKIAHIRDHWTAYLPMRRQGKELAAEAWRPEGVGQQIATLIWAIMEQNTWLSEIN